MRSLSDRGKEGSVCTEHYFHCDAPEDRLPDGRPFPNVNSDNVDTDVPCDTKDLLNQVAVFASNRRQ